MGTKAQFIIVLVMLIARVGCNNSSTTETGVLRFPEDYNNRLSSPDEVIRVGYDVIDIASIKDKEFTIEMSE